MTGLDADGATLIEAAFSMKQPVIAVKALRTETERNEQIGLASFARGISSAVRNPQAHTPKMLWHLSEDDALDVLGMLSLLHRRLDGAVVLPRTGPAQ